ncbi:MAG: hypothetical protein JSS97_06105 [Actinobacteria bacterium]|nr:hypothetical protein [Actinomycetota bacterium]
MSQFPFATPLADWHGPGAWILLLPVAWFACALVFVLILRQLGWGWGRGCGRRGRHSPRRWEEDDAPGPPGSAWTS